MHPPTEQSRLAEQALTRNPTPPAHRLRYAARRLHCALTGHNPGKPIVLLGLSVRPCTRCTRPLI
jgi:hypothetical protein